MGEQAKYMACFSNKVVSTTVTMPKWLKDMAETERVNFSQVLQRALKSQFGIENKKARK